MQRNKKRKVRAEIWVGDEGKGWETQFVFQKLSVNEYINDQ